MEGNRLTTINGFYEREGSSSKCRCPTTQIGCSTTLRATRSYDYTGVTKPRITRNRGRCRNEDVAGARRVEVARAGGGAALCVRATAREGSGEVAGS